MTNGNLQQTLDQFTGSEHLFRHPIFRNVKYTDGVSYLAKEAKAYWLIEMIMSYQAKHSKVPFQLWELIVNQEDDTAVLTMKEDSDKKPLVKRKIDFTDFPLASVKLYLIDGVLLLPTEY